MSSSLYKVDTAPSSTSEHLNITKSDANLTLTLISESGAEFESLEQLGPTVSSILKTKRTDQFLDQLDAFAHKKEMEVERLCKEHYHDFVVAVESLTSIRDGTRELRDRIVHLNDTLQVTGQELVDKVRFILVFLYDHEGNGIELDGSPPFFFLCLVLELISFPPPLPPLFPPYIESKAYGGQIHP